MGSVKPYEVEQWLKGIPRSPKTKSHIRGLMHLLFEHAMKWEMIACQRNPMDLVKINGVTRRTRRKLIITVEQFHALLPLLPSHVRRMVMLAMCTGMRISEILALRWMDIDFGRNVITIRRSIVSRYVADATKNDASADDRWITASLRSCRTGKRRVCKLQRDGYSPISIPGDLSMRARCNRTTFGPQEQRSGSWDWAGIHFGTATEP